MDENISFKKVFLITLIISLCISGLIGIIILLFGKFGLTEIRLILTTLAIGGFSLTALCSSTLYDKKKFVVFSILGIMVSVIGFLFNVIIIWGDVNTLISLQKIAMVFVVLAIFFAHSSLLLLIKSKEFIVKMSLYVTLLFIGLVTLMLVLLISINFVNLSSWYFRILGVFAVLDVIGTIITPILVRVTAIDKKSHRR